MSSCYICQNWSLIDRIGVEKLRQYKRITNIADLFYTEWSCPDQCTSGCCHPSVQSLLDRPRDDPLLKELVQQVYDLTTYEPRMYVKGIVAESQLGGFDLRKAFLDDPTLDTFLNHQKYKYLENLESDRTTVQDVAYQLLKIQVNNDKYGINYRRIFGSPLQFIIYGLCTQQQLHNIYLKHHNAIFRNRIASYLTVEELNKLYENHKSEDLLVLKYAKLPEDHKVEILKKADTLDQKIALLHNLDESNTLEFLHQLECDHKTIPLRLKSLQNIYSFSKLLTLLDIETEPIMRASIYYRLSQLGDPFRELAQTTFNKELYSLQVEHYYFIPLDNLEFLYYNCLMDNPDHMLVDYFLSIISSKEYLQKLSFHTELRHRINTKL